MNPVSMTCLGWDDRLSADYQRHDRPDHWPARVSRAEPGVCTVLGAAGVRRASVAGRMLAAAARDAARLPCPGDWVVVRTWPDERSTVEAVLPRRGIVWRTPGPGPAASNVDLMMRVDDSSGDPDLLDALRALAAPGRTLGLVGVDPRSRCAVVAALAGGAVLPPLAGALVPLPGGGAVIDLQGRPVSGSSAPARADGVTPGVHPSPSVSIQWDDIDATSSLTSLAARATCVDAR